MSHQRATPTAQSLNLGRHSALFLSIALIVAGNGLQGTLLGVRAGLEGMSRSSVGFFMSTYFLGYLVGSLLIPRAVYAVGHIRTFAGLSSIASAVSLAHVLAISVASWATLRSLHGFCYAGIVLVIESWLNANTDAPRRGRVLAVYGSVVLLFLTLGQLLLNAAAPTTFVPFCIVSSLLSLGLVPVTMTNVSAPGVVKAHRMRLGRVFEASPIGVVGVFVIGLTFSAFTGLGPSYALGLGLDTSGISFFMGSALIGALILQWPLGLLSDRIDRRWVILACTAALIAVSAVLANGPDLSHNVVIASVALFGAVSIPTYSVCVAHTIDWVEEQDVIPTTSTLLIVFGVGSIVGPVASGVAMSAAGLRGLFVVIAVANSLVLLYAATRLRRPRPAGHHSLSAGGESGLPSASRPETSPADR